MVDDTSNINKEGFPIDLDYGKFEFIKQLDSGGQGVVCLYKSLKQKDGSMPYPEQVAVKFDPTNETANLKETLWLKEQTKRIEDNNIKINLPTYYMHSFHKGRRYFVMKYLPESLDDLIKSRGEEKRNEMLAKTAV